MTGPVPNDPAPNDFSPIVIGGGLAGLLLALHLAPMPVRLLLAAPLGEGGSTGWAQGGIAAAIGGDDDPALHMADTLAAGDGLCDPAAAALFTRAGPVLIETLARFGVRFDPGLGLEAAHARRRIVHANGDGTGREIMRALAAAVRAAPHIAVLPGVARRLLLRDGGVAGVLAARDGGLLALATDRVAVATGGLGGLYEQGTAPAANWGGGLALAARAGAAMQDMEFVQFHPTALALPDRAPGAPMPLVSEAVRGEGARLVDERGHRFLADFGLDELAPRDRVARAIRRHSRAGHAVLLDTRPIADFARRFPGIAATCGAAGLDPARDPLPVAPAAHYHMGGIATDPRGRASAPGLWALGEAACTGLHGANRLASNSLLEAGVMARLVAEDWAGMPAREPGRPDPDAAAAAAAARTPADPGPVRPLLSEAGGVLRDAAGLRAGIARLRPVAAGDAAAADPAAVALMVLTAALARRESRGAHCRIDHPAPDAEPPARRRSTLAAALASVSAESAVARDPGGRR